MHKCIKPLNIRYKSIFLCKKELWERENLSTVYFRKVLPFFSICAIIATKKMKSRIRD